MKWSISKSKVFQECPKKWVYSDIIANGVAKDPFRKEIHLLKQLKSIHSWRGSVVDTTIEKFIISSLRRRQIPDIDSTLKFAAELSNKQLAFGLKNDHRSSIMSKTAVGDEYCAFFEVEYNGGIPEADIVKAKEEIELALRNLLNSELLKEIASSQSYLVVQRPLQIKFNDSSVLSTPDLIVFYTNKPPIIIDWKVHAGRNTDYWMQLGVYSYVLSLVNPHKDFPAQSLSYLKDPTRIKLIEYQLLKNQTKEYTLTEEDICDIEDYIHTSTSAMKYLLESFKEEGIEVLPTAQFAGSCNSCQFRKVCWGAANYDHD